MQACSVLAWLNRVAGSRITMYHRVYFENRGDVVAVPGLSENPEQMAAARLKPGNRSWITKVLGASKYIADIVKSAFHNRPHAQMPLIPDFTDAELHHIREMLTRRYRKDIEIELATCELILDKNSNDLVAYPTVFWYQRGSNFVVYKTGMDTFRARFFYTPHEQYGTGKDEYNQLDECVAAVLQTQEDHEREGGGVESDSSAKTLK